MFDDDIKIAGSRPSLSINNTNEADAVSAELDLAQRSGDLDKAKALGKMLADKLIRKDSDVTFGMDDGEDIAQRVNLLAFTATVGFEKYCKNSLISATAYGAFFDAIKTTDKNLYDSLSDIGVFSFYYLAYRRGGDVERRIGQTYAMLCGKDGDPVYQELGEALYCHFSQIVKEATEDLGLA